LARDLRTSAKAYSVVLSEADGRLFQMGGVDPGDGGCRHAEMQMIDHRVGVAGLGVGAANLLLDLAETGLDTPSLTPL
jgi:hypothetical protein